MYLYRFDASRSGSDNKRYNDNNLLILREKNISDMITPKVVPENLLNFKTMKVYIDRKTELID